jgi:hypothetical protein
MGWLRKFIWSLSSVEPLILKIKKLYLEVLKILKKYDHIGNELNLKNVL